MITNYVSAIALADLLLIITRLLEKDIALTTNRNHAVSATRQVLITMRFLASGSFEQMTGDSVAGLNKSTVSRIIRRMTVVYLEKLTNLSGFPSDKTSAMQQSKVFMISPLSCV